MVLLALAASLLGSAGDAAAQSAQRYEGTFPDGARYLIEVPPNWNHTLVLYSHGYTVGPANPAVDVGDPVTGAWLLTHGFALGGSSYATTGWALEQAFPDQIQVIDTFSRLIGRPRRTIAWGHSLGGMITAGLVQLHPERFAGALPMCGVVGGGVATWNQVLDGEFVFKTLLAPGSSLQLVGISDPAANLAAAIGYLKAAQATAAGRARIALVAAMSDVPGWYDPASPEPAPHDYSTREQNQYQWEYNVDFFFAFAARAELERRAAGNPSWNTGVDYLRELLLSVDLREVLSLYQAAGLDLVADLKAIQQATRVQADPTAVNYLRRNIVYDGRFGGVPVLTLHTTGDGLVPVQHEDGYADVVASTPKQSDLLRQVFVHRAGHCTFTPAETIVAFQALMQRVDRSEWGNLEPSRLNAQALTLGVGSPFNPAPPAYLRYRPSEFLREYDARGDRSPASEGAAA
ncbi:MAG: prolyl oligopeptidase family serine peptidase [Candidatus Dormibacteraeota bacterium]|nr:prolyl oligopeptidase family serine peptidase [Candidatus Dormibacteraeota bacterium]